MALVETSQTRYIAMVPPQSLSREPEDRELVRWIKQEFDKISKAVSSLEYQFPPMTEAPERYSIGFVAYADGVNWNPGAGEGLYVYKSTGWSLLG